MRGHRSRILHPRGLDPLSCLVQLWPLAWAQHLMRAVSAGRPPPLRTGSGQEHRQPHRHAALCCQHAAPSEVRAASGHGGQPGGVRPVRVGAEGGRCWGTAMWGSLSASGFLPTSLEFHANIISDAVKKVIKVGKVSARLPWLLPASLLPPSPGARRLSGSPQGAAGVVCSGPQSWQLCPGQGPPAWLDPGPGSALVGRLAWLRRAGVVPVWGGSCSSPPQGNWRGTAPIPMPV